MMTHKGYSGVAEIAYDTGMIYGRVVGLRDVITFQGETVAEAQQAFRDSVDDYLEFCASRSEPPEKPFSGRFLVRITPSLHRTLVEAATARGLSLNALVERTLAAEFAGVSATPPDEEIIRAARDKAAAKVMADARRKKVTKVAAGDQTKSQAGRTKAG
jgi:predicted HicB family RNase H-like nuclease